MHKFVGYISGKLHGRVVTERLLVFSASDWGVIMCMYERRKLRDNVKKAINEV